MTYLDHQDEQRIIVYLINNPIAADTKAIHILAPLELLSSRRSRIFMQCINMRLEAPLHVPGERHELSLCMGGKLDTV
jgi:hypothetical protein